MAELQTGAEASTAPSLHSRSLEGPLPLGFAQEGLVSVYDQLRDPETQHIVLARKVVGHLDVSMLQEALDLLAARHAVLRGRYGVHNGQHCMFVDRTVALPIRTADLTALAPALVERAAWQIIEEQRRARFQLTTGPLLHTCLIQLDARVGLLVFVFHHSICDGWSLAIFIRELKSLYVGIARRCLPDLAPMTLQFPDYAAWVRESLAAAGSHITYWNERISGITAPFALPRDPIPASAAQYAAKYPHGARFSAETMLAVRRLARNEKTTHVTVLLAAFAVVLSRWSRSDDVLVSVFHSGRQRPEARSLIGCLVQSWLLRVSVRDSDDLIDVVRRVHETSADAQDHPGVPFVLLKRRLASVSSEQPLLHVTFNYLPTGQNNPDSTWTDDLAVTRFPVPTYRVTLNEGRGEKLVLNFVEEGESITGILRYLPTYFTARTIDGVWDEYRSLLARALSLSGDPFVAAPAPDSFRL